MSQPKFSPWWIVAILLLGFALRWLELDFTQGYSYNMQGDGIEAYSVAVNYANGDAKARYIGQPNYNERSKLPGPAWTLFCYCGLKLGGSPFGIMYEMLLLNTLAIYLAYLLASQTIGQLAGLWTAFLLATFPRVISYSVSVYNPNVMPFFGTLFFLALWQTVQHEKSRAIFWIPFIPLLTLQIHMSGFMLIPTGIAALIICGARVNFPWLLGGIASGFALYTPYIIGEINNHWQNTAGMFSGNANHFSAGVLKIFSSTFGFLVSWSPGWMHDDGEYKEFGRAIFGNEYVLYSIYVLSTIAAVFAFTGIFLLTKKSWSGFQWRSRGDFFRNSGVAFLSICFGLPFLFSLIGGKSFHARYCLVFITPMFALAGLALAKWLASSPRRQFFRWLAGITLLTNLWIVVGTDIYQKNNIEHGAYFLPGFRKLETVYQQLKNHSGKNAAIRIDDDDYRHSLNANDTFLIEALFIRVFVDVRDKDGATITSQKTAPEVYKLYRANEIKPDDPAVAFYGNGIALVAE